MEGIYDRQTSLDLSVPHSICVIGAGGIGSWVAILAAMSGVAKIYIFDPDEVETTNLNRLPLCEGSIGRAKVDVVADFIKTIRPGCEVVAIKSKLEDVTLKFMCTVSSFLIECTDSPKSQLAVFKETGASMCSFIRAGYDGTKITVTSVVSGWIKADSEEETYIINPSWVVPAVTVAALAVGKMCKFFNQEVNLDLSEIGVPILKKRRRLTKHCKT